MLLSVLRYVVGVLTLQTALSGRVAGAPAPWSIPHEGHDAPHVEAGKLGAVASESDVCSRVGIGLLEMGGNAADAMVGTVACVGVVGMYHSGFGGGGFMLVRAPNGTHEFIDFRETAPATAFENMYKDNEEASLRGGLASGVPGEVRGLERLHSHYGILPWSTVLQPAIKLAREGWRVNEDLVKYMERASDTPYPNNSFLVQDPEFAKDFAPNGQLLQLNDTITRKRYATTLETVAREGADAFYTGPIAEATIRALQSANGTMTLADLANYTVALRTPSTINYRDAFQITACSAPSGGPVALSVLKILDGYLGVGDASAVNLTTHRLDEAMKFAYGMRAELGDPSFVANISRYQEQMTSERVAANIRAKISDTQTFTTAYYDPKGLESLDTPGTSHVVTADHSGLSISLTTTVNLLFGSKLVVPETGVIMNNEMNDFSIPNVTNAFGYIPSAANFVRPGKRPLSSISPVIVDILGNSSSSSYSPFPHQNTLYISTGAAGGSRIITSTIQNLIHMLDGNMSVASALAQPRLHDQLVPAQVSFEYAYDNSTTAFLAELGANVTWVAPGQSSAQGLMRLRSGVFEAAGEPRQENSGGFVI